MTPLGEVPVGLLLLNPNFFKGSPHCHTQNMDTIMKSQMHYAVQVTELLDQIIWTFYVA